jgi:hypothetical protein
MSSDVLQRRSGKARLANAARVRDLCEAGEFSESLADKLMEIELRSRANHADRVGSYRRFLLHRSGDVVNAILPGDAARGTRSC